MFNENTKIVDPLGRLIELPAGLCLDEDSQLTDAVIYASVRTVIEAPACLIEMSPTHLCYFRSIGWNNTVLLEALYRQETWTAVRCERNPSTALVQALLADGKFIAGKSLD